MVEIPDRFLEKKRHHVIPRFYLANFTNGGERADGMLWRYERGGGEPIPIHPNDASVIKHFYRAKDVDGEEHNVFEEHLRKLEDIAAPIIRAIVEDRRTPRAEEYASLSLFVASMHYRTAALRDIFFGFGKSFIDKVVYKAAKDPIKWRQKIAEFQSQGFELGGMDPEDLRKWYLNRDNYTISLNPGAAMSLYFKLLPQLAKQIASMDHTIIDARDDLQFLTSDNPVAIVDIGGETGKWKGDFDSSGAQITLPLSSRFTFLASWGGPVGFASCDTFFKRHINKRTACRASRYVFSPFRARFINRWLNELEPMIPKLEWPDEPGGRIRIT